MAKALTPAEITAVCVAHSKWKSGDSDGVRANLSRADLSRADLPGADLSGANLYRANLYRANLSRANLSRADLSRADLPGADLFDADLSGADLSGANLSGANLSGANLSGADLYRANLSGANLYRAIGNGREVCSTFVGHYPICWTSAVLHIGCQAHPLSEWRKADPCWIDAMSYDATAWWARYGSAVMTLVECSPCVQDQDAQQP
jgi:hypothetical protein